MIINNSVQTYAPIAPPYFRGRIYMNATYEFSEQLACLFTEGLEALSRVLYQKQINPSKYLPVNLIFSKDGSFSVTEDIFTTYGRCMPLIVYSMEKIVRCNNEHMQLFIFIEELVHYYFQEIDETIVKKQTLEITKIIFPEMTIEEILSWRVNWN